VLVERARSGDVGAFGLLVQRHQQTALRVAYAVAGSDAEDAVQEAFVKAHAALGRFRPGAPFRPWLLRIVANEASNRRRAAGRRVHLALRAAGSRPSGDAAPSPEEAALMAERRTALAAALATLSDADRLVIACRWFAELSEADMAIALDCRPGTVKSRLARAMTRLRAALPADLAAMTTVEVPGD
jgi:RNA polymerase sigma factor (sigma-70 family)